MPEVQKIEAKKQGFGKKKSVAAYCRVSKETEKLMHSIANQISYYSNLIQSNPEWEYAGVYADEGITGTMAAKRPEFQRMLADCDAGKIDIILTKSISRFARNTLDMLNTVRHLRELGIEVRFEEQHINTLSGDGELMLTIYASFAQEESRGQSESIRWQKRKKQEKGEMTNGSVPYGYRYKDGEITVDPKEAKVVEMIFRDYAENGLSIYEIRDKLDAAGIRGKFGGKITETTVYRMLRNEFYIGDLLLEKYYKVGLTHKTADNKGEKPMFYSEDAHEAIISRELFGKTKARFDENAAKWGPYASGTRRKSCFSGKIICGGCGRPMHRAILIRGDGTHKAVVWRCNRKVRKCNVHNPLETDVMAIVADALGLDDFSEDAYKKAVDHMEIGEDDILRVFLRNGQEKTYLLKRRKRGRGTYGKEEATWQRK